MKTDTNLEAFFELLKAGLLEKEVRLSAFQGIDFNEVLKLAQEQSVVGVVAAGLEHVTDVEVPRNAVLQFVGSTMQIEHRNRAMNEFLAWLLGLLRSEGVNAVLVKGQGIAQCYERPLWRAAGDVDLLLDAEGYARAKEVIAAQAQVNAEEMLDRLHWSATVGSWEVELHGTLRTGIGRRIDRVIDAVQDDTFKNEHVRAWDDGSTEVFLPSADDDVFFVFTHILQHFFKEGVGLRQICDWCRLLWTFRDELDVALLESRLRTAGLMREWRAFAALAVDWLGMPADAVPLYSSARRWHRKACKVVSFILETGNMGHNRDMSYKQKYPYVVYKSISLWRHTHDAISTLVIFPWRSVCVWCRMFAARIVVAVHGK